MIKLKTAPESDLVAAYEVRDFLRMSSEDYDDTLLLYAQAATKQAEDYCRRAFITQTWQLMLNSTQVKDIITLPRAAPLQSITSVKVYNDAGTATTESASLYFADTYTEPGRIILYPTASWRYTRDLNGMLIEYVCGYGDFDTDVPTPIKTAIIEAAAYGYVNGKIAELPEDTLQKLKPYRVYL